MANLLTIVNFLALFFISISQGESVCSKERQFTAFASDDCTQWLLCTWSGSAPRVLVTCKDGQTYSRSRKSCVKSNPDCKSKESTCGLETNPCRHGGTCIYQTEGTRKRLCACRQGYSGEYCQIEPSLRDQCSMSPFARIPDLDKCHVYHECGIDGEPQRKECEYPLLFEAKLQTCMDPKDVKCGNRKIFKSKCSYTKYQQRKYVHGSCETVYPSCEKKTDGFHQQSGSRKRYMICENERLKTVGICSSNRHGPQMATKTGCKSIFDVSPKNGGWQPDCSGMEDGYYPLKNGGCHQYFLCKKGKALVRECPLGSVFVSDLNIPTKLLPCKEKAAACRPCGYKKCGA